MANEDRADYDTGRPAGALDLEGWVLAQHPDHQTEALKLALALNTLIDSGSLTEDALRELLLSLADHLQGENPPCDPST